MGGGKLTLATRKSIGESKQDASSVYLSERHMCPSDASHANTSQSHVKTRANTSQEFLNLLEAMQILRRAM